MQITLNNYQKLLAQIQKTIGETERRIVADVNHEKVAMSWQIGKIIEEHLLKNNRANYGAQFFAQLEKDILIAKRTLYQMRTFYKTYPVLPKKEKGLNWSHYRNLLVVKSDERRKYLEDLAVEKKLGSNELQKKISAIKKPSKKNSKQKNTKLKFNRGTLFTYKIAALKGSKKTFVDCGFNVFTEVKTSLKGEGEIVQSIKAGEKISLKKSKLDLPQLHTYKAFLDKVVDGDTLRVTLDLGFKIRHKEILRLAKINAPEAGTFEGKKSTQALEKMLKNTPFLIIKTTKTDIYGRYIADVFLAEKNETNPQKVADGGRYLNQMLIDSGVAGALNNSTSAKKI
jgi:endonuclease YncB( thermonuclease family)